MSDPDSPRKGLERKKRPDRVEPVDTRLWELPDQDAVEPRPSRDVSSRWIVPALVGLAIIVVLIALWLL